MKDKSRFYSVDLVAAALMLVILGVQPAESSSYIFPYSPTFTYWNITYPRTILGAVCPSCGYGFNLYQANTSNRNYLGSLSSSYASQGLGGVFSSIESLLSIPIYGAYGNTF